ncbi:MAG: NUDIX domain-containing protein [bacterium]
MSIIQSIYDLTNRSICSPPVYVGYLKRIVAGDISKAENSTSHFCTYFLPYNPETGEIFLIHHKKSGLWLAPGGHLDKDETPTDTLKREVMEELGFEIKKPETYQPFLLTMTKIPTRPNSTCRMHYDIWYAIPTDGREFAVDMTEFFASQWISLEGAREIVIDRQNLTAFAKIEEMLIKVP